MFQAFDALEPGRRIRGVVEPSRGGLVQGLHRESGLAASGDAGDAGEGADGDLAGDVLEIIAAGPDDANHAGARDRPTLRRDGNLAGADKILTRETSLGGHDVRWRALGHHLAAVDARRRAHVDHIVRGQDGFLVVLDHQHGVPQVAQALEALEQTGVVALMQADGRFVEHIEDAGKA